MGNKKYTSEQLAWLIRRRTAQMTHDSKSGHIGSVYSMADILAVLYGEVLKYKPEDPKWEDRDRFVLSKGHASAGLFSVLADTGFFPVADLNEFGQNGSCFIEHVSHMIPGIEVSTGSLGHGISMAAGMALAAKKDRKNFRVYVIVGDGECNEGSVWEAVMFANQFQLSNLTVIVDYNHIQSLDTTDNTMCLDPLGDKFKAFGWAVQDIDGHDFNEIRNAFSSLSDCAPNVIIANTIKGKGVSFIENDVLWHYRFPHDGWEYDGTVNELTSVKPDGVEDPYTPGGIENPELPDENADLDKKHAMSDTYHPTFYKLGGR